MLVYLCIPLVIIFLYFLVYRTGLQKTLFLLLSIVFLFMISSIRSKTIGADSNRYGVAFHIIETYGHYYMEKGYEWLNRIVAHFTSNFSVLIITVNILFFLPLYYYIKKHVDKNYWIYSVLIVALQPYIYLQTTFNIIRQACAISFVLIGMHFYINSVKFKHKFTGYILFNALTIIGAQFHRASYFMLAIPLVFLIKWNKVKWRVLAFVFLLLNLFDFSRLLIRLERLIGKTNYSNYSASILDNPAYVLVVFAFILWLTSSYDKIKIEQWDKRFYDLYIFSISFLIFAVSNDMVYRMYIMLAIISLPAIQTVVKNDRSVRVKTNNSNSSEGKTGLYTVILFCYYFSFWIGYILYLYYTNNSAYIPYRTFFSDV